MKSKQILKTNRNVTKVDCSPTLPRFRAIENENEERMGLVCPNCGADLEGRKCKLLGVRPGCGYQVTCSEW